MASARDSVPRPRRAHRGLLIVRTEKKKSLCGADCARVETTAHPFRCPLWQQHAQRCSTVEFPTIGHSTSTLFYLQTLVGSILLA